MAHENDNLARLAGAMILCLAAPLFGLASDARAQWAVVNLHPAGATESRASGVSGATQVGRAMFDGYFHASLWLGSAESWVDLSPAGSPESWINAVGGGEQVGSANVPPYPHASLWSGSAGSWIDLNPAGVVQSVAVDAADTWQVGWVALGGNWRASLWHGSAASWVNLNPTLASWSEAWGVDGLQQVGRARMNGVTRACLWQQTPASWTDLHVAGAMSSCALDAHAGTQVGYISVGVPHACLWTGTAASYVNLNPEGATESNAFGVHLDEQVGYVFAGGVHGAALWRSSAASWVNLHALLPAEYDESEARGIWHDGSSTCVAGWGHNTLTGRDEALLWVRSSSASSPDAEKAFTAPRLDSVQPSPCLQWTRITFALPAEGHVRLDVLDASGRHVETVLDAARPGGISRLSWDATRRPAGTYFFRMRTAGTLLSQRVIVLK